MTQSETSNNKWYQKNGGIIALLIIFWPVGLYLMWQYATWNKAAKWVITGFIVFCGLVFLTADGSSTTSQTLQPTNSNEQVANSANSNEADVVVAEEQSEPESPFTTFKDGTSIVGTDIPAGTYRTRKGSSGCYYERLAGFSGSFDDIISNDNTDGPAVITIADTDAGFQSNRCGTWTDDLSQITDSMTSFGAGTYIVGTDIEAGTYRNEGNDGCYYERLSGFSGSFDDIIANENTDAQAIVTISASDKGFTSARCGTWTKI